MNYHNIYKYNLLNKSLLFILTFFFITNTKSVSQVVFKYDESGNCIEKYKTIVMPKNKSQQKARENQEDIYIEILENHEIVVFPNPTKGILNININSPENVNSQIVIFDTNGRRILRKNLNENYYTLDLSGYTDGIYILRIKINGNYTEWKIIKE